MSKQRSYTVVEGGFTVRRSLAEKSQDELAFVKDIEHQFPFAHLGIKDVSVMALTLLESGEVLRARRYNHALGQLATRELINKVLRPLPLSAEYPLEVRVDDVAFLGFDGYIKSLALVLGGMENILAEERSIFSSRVSKNIRWREQIPHLTLARVDLNSATSDMLDWVRQQVPGTIQVDPVSTQNSISKTDYCLTYLSGTN